MRPKPMDGRLGKPSAVQFGALSLRTHEEHGSGAVQPRNRSRVARRDGRRRRPMGVGPVRILQAKRCASCLPRPGMEMRP